MQVQVAHPPLSTWQLHNLLIIDAMVQVDIGGAAGEVSCGDIAGHCSSLLVVVELNELVAHLMVGRSVVAGAEKTTRCLSPLNRACLVQAHAWGKACADACIGGEHLL
jgi:hypothetical protein